MKILQGMVAETSRTFPALGCRKIAAIFRSHGKAINAKPVARLRRRDGLEAVFRQFSNSTGLPLRRYDGGAVESFRSAGGRVGEVNR